jgi:hypothetical protein
VPLGIALQPTPALRPRPVGLSVGS